MHRPGRARLLLLLLLVSSLGAAGLGLVPDVSAQREPVRDDEWEGDPGEWEEQVANDARGDVLVRHTGTIDLYYMVIGELYPTNLGESYMIVRIGYDITGAGEGDTDAELPGTPPGLPGAPIGGVPPLAPQAPLAHINVTFNVSDDRSERFTLLTGDLGQTWASGASRFVFNNNDVDGHKEVAFIAPLRRFALQDGDTLSDYNVTAYREARVVDTMEGYEPAHDLSPNYPSPRRIAEDPAGLVPPLPVPLPAPPVPVPDPNDLPLPDPPVPVPDPVERVPDEYPYPPEGGQQGIPYGVPTRDDVEEFVDERQSRDRSLVEPERLTEEPDRPTGGAWNTTHTVTDGTTRFIVRADDLVVRASTDQVGFANFTIESLFDETPQRVLMLAVIPPNSEWLFRYGLDMPNGMKVLPPDEPIRMSAIAAPSNLFATRQMQVTFVFLSDWGGLEFVPITFVNTAAPPEDTRQAPSSRLPRSLLMDFITEDDPWRVNELRRLRFEVRSGETLQYYPNFEQLRAYIYPAGSEAPPQPYQLFSDPLQPGTYYSPFTFDRPGAWVVDVHAFDYTARADGTFPSSKFIVNVDYNEPSTPLLPTPLALGSVALVGLAVAARERLAKSR